MLSSILAIVFVLKLLKFESHLKQLKCSAPRPHLFTGKVQSMLKFLYFGLNFRIDLEKGAEIL